MNKRKSYRSSSRSISDLKAHLVLTTKYRRKAISGAMLQRLNEIIQDLSAKWGVEVVEVNGEPDHLHLLFGYYPQLQLSKYINNLKTVSSRMLRQEFETELWAIYKDKPVLWNNSYFIASCGGVTVEQLKEYVKSQDNPID